MFESSRDQTNVRAASKTMQQAEEQARQEREQKEDQDDAHDSGQKAVQKRKKRKCAGVTAAAEQAQSVHDEMHVTEKDWYRESLHLQQHLHFATLYVMRHAPNVTSTGARITYHLPPVIRALLVDRLTSRYATSTIDGSASNFDCVSLHLDYWRAFPSCSPAGTVSGGGVGHHCESRSVLAERSGVFHHGRRWCSGLALRPGPGSATVRSDTGSGGAEGRGRTRTRVETTRSSYC